MEPIKAPEPRQGAKEADHEQEHRYDHMKRHQNPRWLELETWRASLRSKDKESHQYCQATSREVRILHHQHRQYPGCCWRRTTMARASRGT